MGKQLFSSEGLDSANPYFRVFQSTIPGFNDWYSLGHRGQTSISDELQEPILVFRNRELIGGAIKRSLGTSRVWDDGGDGPGYGTSVWRLSCPSG